MDERQARDWLAATFGASALSQLQRLHDLVAGENERQNLIAHSTVPQMWSRHISDSAQLIPLAAGRSGNWMDIGTGGGFPGLVVACLRSDPVYLVEPRRRRASFLQDSVVALGLKHVTVVQALAQDVCIKASIVSARAVAPVDALVAMADQCTDRDTLWLLPRGASDSARSSAKAPSLSVVFHVEQSLTNPSSIILVGRSQ